MQWFNKVLEDKAGKDSLGTWRGQQGEEARVRAGRAVGCLHSTAWGSSWASPAWYLGLGMLFVPSDSGELVP